MVFTIELLAPVKLFVGEEKRAQYPHCRGRGRGGRVGGGMTAYLEGRIAQSFPFCAVPSRFVTKLLVSVVSQDSRKCNGAESVHLSVHMFPVRNF